ncbi:ABC transporter permease [Spirosoma sp. BT702]|uniref:ABC transporter permease n=1 Tax=Spirosoma profusum TaxID=2771354 RepID=A0A926XYA8_9BACT|nr:ABC transporter permease [Spirosoma profusum]MBD2702346.1 ABC transporter permease [Spirosoma profusum]
MNPPRLADRLLRLFCASDRLEEVQGDLHEEFTYQLRRIGQRRARWRYWWDVVGFISPFAIRRETKAYSIPNSIHPMMIRNYLKIAFRSLAKNKVYSFINIGGLAVGMAVALLIGLWVYDELTFNAYHKNHDRIARVVHQRTVNGEILTTQGIPIPVAKVLQNEYGTDFRHVTLSSWNTRHMLTFGDTKFTKMGAFMTPDAPELLSLKMIKGSPSGLQQSSSILLSESVAKALFGSTDPLDKLIKIDNNLDVKVTGIYEDIPYNSEFQDLRFIAPWDLYVASTDWVKKANDENEWGQNSFQLFVQLAENVNPAAVSEKIRLIKQQKGGADEVKFQPEIHLYPMNRWHLHTDWVNGENEGGRIEFVWLFSCTGLFVLLLACINFMNLSTARSEKRAKEVGIRKAIGSLRRQLISQFLSESFLVVGLSFVLALLMAQLTMPFFNDVADKQMTMPWLSPFFWLAGLSFCLITGLLTGSYPAFYLSSFQPIKVLKGTISGLRFGRMAGLPRKVLVVMQFTVSITLIVGTVVVYRQILHAKNRPIGYNREGLVMMHMSTPDIHDHFDAVRDELTKSGTVLALAESMSPATDVWSNNTGFNWKGKDPALQTDFATIGVSHDFGRTVGWKFTDGRDFSRAIQTDSSGFVLNEAAVKFMGLKRPVGQIVQWGDRSFKVIGVVKDMLMSSPYDPVKQTIYFIPRRAANFVTIRINPASSANEALQRIEVVFKKYNPSSPFNYDFVDTEYALKFAAEERIGKLASVFATLAIFISCLGLFGLASFIAEQRTKEIGVRKVLGASVLNLWGLVSKDFVVLVIIAFGIATPIAYNFLNKWLQKYEYRTDISWWIFAATGAGALFITLLTVSFQSIKAALVNPVKSLRSE